MICLACEDMYPRSPDLQEQGTKQSCHNLARSTGLRTVYALILFRNQDSLPGNWKVGILDCFPMLLNKPQSTNSAQNTSWEQDLDNFELWVLSNQLIRQKFVVNLFISFKIYFSYF